VRIAGTAVINGELNRAARRDMFMFFPAVAAFLALLGWVIFRNVRDVCVLLCVSLGTVIVTEGLLVASGYHLNMVTIMLPTVLIALSVADAVHLIHAFHASRQHVGESVRAARYAVKLIAWPCAGTTLTTIAGFLAFSGSSVLPVFQLAVFASFGIALAWALTMTVAPILLIVLWQCQKRVDPPVALLGRRLLRKWSRFVTRHPRRIVVAFALASVALLGLPSLQADTDYVKFFRAGTRVPLDYERLQQMGFPQNPLGLVFSLPADLGPLDERHWPPLQSFTRRLESLPGVHSVLSPFVMSGSFEVADDHIETLGGMLSRQTNEIQLTVMMDYPSSQRLFTLLPQIRELAQQVLPAEMKLTPTGTSYLWARMDDGVIETQKESLAIVCIACFVILVFLFRSVGLGVLGLALSIYPVAMVLGLMGLLHIPVNLATVLIAGIAVGLAVDDTIHFMHAFQESRRQGNERRSASEHAIVGVGLRMVVTSLILVGSFASMGFSNFTPTSQFGLLSSLTIGLALAADLALLPALFSHRRAAVAQTFAQHESVTTVHAEATVSRRSAWARTT
ncbi:MAG: MMPL family transporter, partial [Gemmatimonadota bacterium]